MPGYVPGILAAPTTAQQNWNILNNPSETQKLITMGNQNQRLRMANVQRNMLGDPSAGINLLADISRGQAAGQDAFNQGALALAKNPAAINRIGAPALAFRPPAIQMRAKGGPVPEMPEGVTIVGEEGKEAIVHTPHGQMVIPADRTRVMLSHVKDVLGKNKDNLHNGQYWRGDFRGLTPQQVTHSVAMGYVPKDDGMMSGEEGAPVRMMAEGGALTRADWTADDLAATIAAQRAAGRLTSEQAAGMNTALGAGISPEEVSRYGSQFVGMNPDTTPAPTRINPYAGNANAPYLVGQTPEERQIHLERFNDLGARLSALHQEGVAAGRQAVSDFWDRNQAGYMPQSAMPEGGALTTGAGGAKKIVSPYGTGIISDQGGIVKDFPIVLKDGTVKHFDNLADREKEGGADLAQRHVEGQSTADFEQDLKRNKGFRDAGHPEWATARKEPAPETRSAGITIPDLVPIRAAHRPTDTAAIRDAMKQSALDRVAQKQAGPAAAAATPGTVEASVAKTTTPPDKKEPDESFVDRLKRETDEPEAKEWTKNKQTLHEVFKDSLTPDQLKQFYRYAKDDSGAAYTRQMLNRVGRKPDDTAFTTPVGRKVSYYQLARELAKEQTVGEEDTSRWAT